MSYRLCLDYVYYTIIDTLEKNTRFQLNKNFTLIEELKQKWYELKIEEGMRIH